MGSWIPPLWYAIVRVKQKKVVFDIENLKILINTKYLEANWTSLSARNSLL
jgi:hypothetical protein